MAYLAALVVGASLAVSGAVLQSVLRNPLAEPYLLGMVGGGALFAALATSFGIVALGAFVIPAASLAGSCVSLSLVLCIAWLAERARAAAGGDAATRSSQSTLVVAGFTVGALAGSLDMLVLAYSTPEAFNEISKWLYGSLDSASAGHVAFGGVAFAAAFAALMMSARELDVLELGRDEAECLGVDTRRTLLVAVCAAAVATSVSVAIAGAVGFVGLVVPHFVRRAFGPRMKRLLPLCAAAGGLFTAAAEAVARLLPHGDKIGVGVVCAIAGAPLFLCLLASSRNGEGRDV